MKTENGFARKIKPSIIFRCQQMVELATAPQLKTQGVHSRKLKLIKQKLSQDTKDDLNSEDEEHFSTEEEKQDSDSGSQDSEGPTTCKRQKTDYAINLVTKAKLSSRKAYTVCKTLAKDGISIPTPSESVVYKATMKAGEKLKEHFIETLRNEN